MLEFNEELHQYTLVDENTGEKKDLISVTQLMQKHGLAPNYAGVSTEVLNAKAERGSLIHKEIEDFNKKNEIGFTEEVAQFKEYIEKNNVRVKASELQINNDIVAGTCDLILNYGKGCYVIADIKTTYQLHLEAVSWQLSIYAYLIGDERITTGQAFHFDKNGKLNVVYIPLKPMSEIERLMECERLGIIYQPNEIEFANTDITEFVSLEKLIKTLDAQVKEAKAKQENLKEALLKEMEERNLKTYEKNGVKITYVAPSTRSTIDSAKLKKDLPEIAEKYTKETQVKASLRITLQEEQDE